jgi:hypothetical protein
MRTNNQLIVFLYVMKMSVWLMFSLSLVSYSYVWYSAFGAQTTAYRFLTFKLAKVHYDVHFSQFIFTFGALDSVTCRTYCTVSKVCSANELFFLDSKLQPPIATQSRNEFVYLLISIKCFFICFFILIYQTCVMKNQFNVYPEDEVILWDASLLRETWK